MKQEIKIECPNCTEPLTIAPDKLSPEYITCGHCAMKHEGSVVKKAVKKELHNLVKAYNKYLETVDL